MSDRLPARIDRATLERVLQRAAEIGVSSHDVGDGMSEDEVIALAAEVGLPVQHVRQALLEERTRAVVRAPEGMIDRLVGVGDLEAQRVVAGTPDAVMAALARYLDHHEHFVVQRATVGRTTFEPMPGFAGAMRKVGAIFDGGRGPAYLGRADLLTAIVTPLEAGFVHVSLGASLRATRRGYVYGATALAATGVLGAAGMVALGAAEVAALIPAAGGVGFSAVTARAYRPVAERVQLGLERTLDALERGQQDGSPGRPTSRIARQVGEVVRELTTEVRKALDP